MNCINTDKSLTIRTKSPFQKLSWLKSSRFKVSETEKTGMKQKKKK